VFLPKKVAETALNKSMPSPLFWKIFSPSSTAKEHHPATKGHKRCAGVVLDGQASEVYLEITRVHVDTVATVSLDQGPLARRSRCPSEFCSLASQWPVVSGRRPETKLFVFKDRFANSSAFRDFAALESRGLLF
jgi:hypothetical protein